MNRRADVVEELKIVPPARFNFSNNYNETVTCLRALKTALSGRGIDKPTKRIHVDFTVLQEISVAGALVLAAEIDRWRAKAGRKLRTKHIENWNASVHALLTSLGFFDLLHVKSTRKHRGAFPAQITVLPMISSTYLKADLLQDLHAQLALKAQILHRDPAIYGGLVEAAYNTTKHAYPEDHTYEFDPFVKGWWATACWNPDDDFVKFIVYDQGVGIPATLPRWEGWETLRGYIIDKLGGAMGPAAASAMKDSSRLIEAAIQMDRTSLSGGHGKGLQDVVAVVEGKPGAKVRILSGTGQLVYHHDGRIEKRDEALHIGGTLIEWTIPISIDDRV